MTSDKATYKVGETATFTAAADFPDRVASFNWTGATDNGITATRVITVGENKVTVTVGPKAGVLPAAGITCTKIVTGVEEPKLYVACESLMIAPVKSAYTVGETVTYTIKADFPERVASYNWVNAVGNGTTATRVVTATGNKVSVTITAKPGFIVTPVSCEKDIVVEEVKVPVYSCDSLDAVVTDGRKVTITVRATALNGATVTGYSYDYTDGTVNVNSHNTTTDSDSHTYVNGGKHKIVVTINFMVNGVAKTVTCQTNVDCEQPPVLCDVKGKETLPKDSPNCFENCTVKGKETLPKTSADCKEVLGTTTTVLPDTGAGNMIGLFAGVSVAGAMMHRMIAARKFNR